MATDKSTQQSSEFNLVGSMPGPVGDSTFKFIRDPAILTTGVVIANKHTGGGSSDGYINILKNTTISLIVDFTKGSLDSVTITPFFTDNKKAQDYQPALLDLTAASGKINLTVISLELVADFRGIFQLQNPGFPWVKFTVQGAGTVTGSSLDLQILRNWSGVTMAGINV